MSEYKNYEQMFHKLPIHTLLILPYRVVMKFIGVAQRCWETGNEYGFMVYGTRDRKELIRTGFVRRGTPERVVLKVITKRKMLLTYHTHPYNTSPLPSIGDIIYVEYLHGKDLFGTFEGFAIGYPTANYIGRIATYMVTDWKLLEEVADNTYDAYKKYNRYLSGEVSTIPKEVYDAQSYLWEKLPEFTERRDLKYELEIRVEVKITDVVPITFTHEDVKRFVIGLRKAPGFEVFR